MLHNNHFNHFRFQRFERSLGRTPVWLTLILVMVGLVMSGMNTSLVSAQAARHENKAPTFPEIAAITVNADNHEKVSFTLSASDYDHPAQTLTYESVKPLPEGATLNPTTGQFTWTPTQAQGGQTYFLSLRVKDNGIPQRAAAQTVRITVESANLLKNAGFQTAGQSAKQADNWNGKGLLSSDKRLCKRSSVNEGACAFLFSATPDNAKNRKLRQNISTDSLLSGDVVNLAGTFRAKALTNGAKVQLAAKLANGQTGRATVKLTTNGVNTLATVHSFEQTLTLTAAPVKMWLEISTGKSSGKLFLDNLLVIETTPTSTPAAGLNVTTGTPATLIPVPAAPDLRGGAAIGQ